MVANILVAIFSQIYHLTDGLTCTNIINNLESGKYLAYIKQYCNKAKNPFGLSLVNPENPHKIPRNLILTITFIYVSTRVYVCYT